MLPGAWSWYERLDRNNGGSILDRDPVIPEGCPALLHRTGGLPHQPGDRRDVEGKLGALKPHDHSGKLAPEGIAQLNKTIRPRPGDVCKNDPASMELGENFLVDARMLERLAAVDHRELIA